VLLDQVHRRNERSLLAQIEGALAVQMACTHTVSMAVLARFGGGGGTERRVIALGATAALLLKAYAHQVEAL
jgi:hypothetical protein